MHRSRAVRAIFGGAKVIFGGAKVIFGGAKVIFGGAKVIFGGAKVVFGGAKVVFGGAKVIFGGAKVVFGGVKVVFGGVLHPSVGDRSHACGACGWASAQADAGANGLGAAPSVWRGVETQNIASLPLRGHAALR